MLSLLLLSLSLSVQHQFIESPSYEQPRLQVEGRRWAIAPRRFQMPPRRYNPFSRRERTWPRFSTIARTAPGIPRAVSALAHGKGPCKLMVHWSAFRGVLHVLRRDSDALVAA